MANMMFMWPTRFDATSYVIRVTIDGTTENLTFPASGSLDTTLDYWPSGDSATGLETDGSGRADVLKMLQDTLRTHTKGAAVTVALTNFRVVISNATAVQLLWSNIATTLDTYAPLWGYSGTASSDSGTTVTSPRAPRGILRFGCPPATDSRKRQPVTVGGTMSLTGRVRAAQLSAPQRTRDLTFVYLTATTAIEHDVDGQLELDRWECIEYVWTHSLSAGRLFRIYDDETASYYDGHRIRPPHPDPLTRNQRYPVLWDASFKTTLEFET